MYLHIKANNLHNQTKGVIEILVKGLELKNTLSVDEIVSVYKLEFGTGRKKIGDVHDYPEILYILKGMAHILVDGKPHTLHAGSMFMYAPNAYHTGDKNSVANVLIISFKSDSKKLKHHYNKVIELDSKMQKAFLDILDSSLSSFCYKYSQKGKRTLVAKEGVAPYEIEVIKKKLEIFLLSIESRIKNKQIVNSKYQDELMAVIDTMNENISENLTLSEIAMLNAMSQSKLKLLFRRQLDTSPLVYFQQLKIEEAKKLLHNTDITITEISEKLGFNSIHYFSRFFKKHMGISPREYVIAVKNGENTYYV